MLILHPAALPVSSTTSDKFSLSETTQWNCELSDVFLTNMLLICTVWIILFLKNHPEMYQAISIRLENIEDPTLVMEHPPR